MPYELLIEPHISQKHELFEVQSVFATICGGEEKTYALLSEKGVTLEESKSLCNLIYLLNYAL